jgi:hypothetical protein
MSFFLHDSYGSAGLHPNGVQQAIYLEYTADGVVDEKSPFGQRVTPNQTVPGFSAVYSLNLIGDPYDTFAATGLEDKPAGIVDITGTPVPRDIKTEDEAMDWLDMNLRFQGFTNPMTEALKLDNTHTFVVMVNGATDVIVNEDVIAGDTLVWRPTTKKRRDDKAKTGTMLERSNPQCPDIVPLRTEYFVGTLRDTTAKVIRLLKPSDFVLAPNGDYKITHLSSLLDRILTANQDDIGGETRGKKRQIMRILGMMENALSISAKVNKFAKGKQLNQGEINDEIDAIAEDTGALAGNVGDHYSDIACHKVGRAHKNAKSGFTTFAQVNTGSS